MKGTQGKLWFFVAAVFAGVLGAIAFLVTYAEGEPEWPPLVIALAMFGMAASWLRNPGKSR